MQLSPSRRGLLAAAALVPLAARAQTQPSLRVGDFTVTPLLDGAVPIGLEMIPDAANAQGEALLAAAGRPPRGPDVIPVNAFAVRRGERLWLLDGGCGGLLGPDLGRAAAALQAGGVDPARVETVLLTHLHVDHFGGLLLPDGAARYPAAELVVQEAEVAFWSDDGAMSRAPAALASFFTAARTMLAAYAGRVRRVSGAAALAPGLTAMPLPGHTPGHAGILIEDGSERLLVWGDVVHSAVLQLPHPDWGVTFDVDPAQAKASRARLLDMAVVERLRVAGMHLATQGQVERRGAGYALAG